MQFFAAACDPTRPSSTMPSLFVSIPSLPAAKQITQSGWLNTKSSISFELCVYGNSGRHVSPGVRVHARLVVERGPEQVVQIVRNPAEPPAAVQQRLHYQPGLGRRALDHATHGRRVSVAEHRAANVGAMAIRMSVLPGRPNGASFTTRPVKAGWTLVIDPRSKPVSATATSSPSPSKVIPFSTTRAFMIGRASLLNSLTLGASSM